jgi:hypothetical protein
MAPLSSSTHERCSFPADIDETHRGVLVKTHHCLVDQNHRRATQFSNAYRVALAEPISKLRGVPTGLLTASNLNPAFD